jgi:phosphoglycerate kinase
LPLANCPAGQFNWVKNMNIRKMQDSNFTEKKVLIRADFNVGIVNGKIQEKYKLKACKETVDFLLKQDGTKIALMSHLGRPEGKASSEFSLLQIRKDLEEILGTRVVFVADCIGNKVTEALNALNAGEVLLLENVRFHGGDEKNDESFSKKLAQHFDIFVNEAFSVCHRSHASVTGVAKILPSYAGFWLQKEIHNLNKIIHEPEYPATAIIGGAKIETKLPLIKAFEKTYTNVLVGGKISVEAEDQNMTFSPKVIMPSDYAKDRLDIGDKTILRFKNIIAMSRVIVWNGPMGKFEETPYDKGTRAIMEAIIDSDAYSLIGGGESVQAVEESGNMEKISFVSTGGGAMLEYLSGNKMPGIDALLG